MEKELLHVGIQKTLRDRILAINYVKDKIKFILGDAFEVLEQKT